MENTLASAVRARWDALQERAVRIELDLFGLDDKPRVLERIVAKMQFPALKLRVSYNNPQVHIAVTRPENYHHEYGEMVYDDHPDDKILFYHTFTLPQNTNAFKYVFFARVS